MKEIKVNKQTRLTQKQTLSLFTLGQKRIITSAKGIYRIPDGEGKIENLHKINQQYVSVAILNLQDFKKLPFHDNTDYILGVQFGQQEGNLVHLWEAEFSQNTNGKAHVVRLIINLNRQNYANIIDLILYLQKNNYWVICSLKHSESDLEDPQKYQSLIYQFTRQITARNAVYMSGLSYQVQALQNQAQLEIITLCIWKRVIPSCVASIIVKDWKSKIIFNMHFIKNLPLYWPIQFITSELERAELLGLECIGAE